MNQKDTWFLGLLALAYLYLDSLSTPPQMSDDAPPPASLPADESLDPSRLLPVPVARALPAKVVPRDVCPRNQLHAVALRADGAMWCRGCDEAFYPQGAIWEVLMSVAAA
jgi:hypothetical protein